MTDATRDAWLAGSAVLWQPRRGYRANVDAIFLAGFAAQKNVARVVDLGAGVGAVTVALARFVRIGEALCVEPHAGRAELARRNLEENGVRGAVLVGTASDVPDHCRAELVLANPPFFVPGSGRPRRDADDASARAGDLAPFVSVAARVLDGRARAAFVYPARELQRLLDCAARAMLVAKRLRAVHPRSDQPARVVLVELCRARPGGLVVEPPLVEWSAPGERTAEVASWIRGVRATDHRRSPRPRAR